MKRNRTTTRKLHVESLERRCLLTGNVAVNVTGHTLILTGHHSDTIALPSRQGNTRRYLIPPTGDRFRFQEPTTNHRGRRDYRQHHCRFEKRPEWRCSA
jgi:hypothetical protein